LKRVCFLRELRESRDRDRPRVGRARSRVLRERRPSVSLCHFDVTLNRHFSDRHTANLNAPCIASYTYVIAFIIHP
jgi:hypothetical protein